MSSFPFIPRFSELPEVVPVFPLAGAVLLPECQLPLNIFEPRYIQMVQDAMRSNQLIGMIQPLDKGVTPSLYAVGCVGRIVQYDETLDGRIQILLHGVCRFRVAQEVSNTRNYRTVQAEWQEFEADYNDLSTDYGSKEHLLKALKTYFQGKEIDADWKTIEQLNSRELVNKLFGYLPLSTEDKQKMIESDNGMVRYTTLLDIITGAIEVQSSLKH